MLVKTKQVKIKKTKPSAAQSKNKVKTKLGWLVRIGTNPWGKAMVKCPQCGEAATAGKSGDVWCRACGFDTATMVGCT
jgi:hypothetical protein